MGELLTFEETGLAVRPPVSRVAVHHWTRVGVSGVILPVTKIPSGKRIDVDDLDEFLKAVVVARTEQFNARADAHNRGARWPRAKADLDDPCGGMEPV